MSLAVVKTFQVAETAVEETERQLREAGMKGFERWVLWTGRQTDDRFEVRTVHVPEQTAYRSAEGLCVRVEGPALHKLNVWLLEHEEILGVQVHAHPGRAYHSTTDDTFSIVTALGGLSVVAADYCRDGLLTRATVGYRLTPSGWRRSRRLRRLLKVAH